MSVETARRAPAGRTGWSPINQPPDKLGEMIAAYRDAGGRGTLPCRCTCPGRPTEDEAVAIAYDQWRSNVVRRRRSAGTWTTAAHFDARQRATSREDQVRTAVNVSADLGQHAEWLAEYLELGFDELYLHHVGQEQEPFIDAFAEHVLPQLRADEP